MAMLTKRFHGDFDSALAQLHHAVMEGSASASYEEGDDVRMREYRCAVRMYERYSWSGGNRVAMSLTLVGVGQDLHLTAITAGGSQALFFKFNTWGEKAFLDKLDQLL